MRPQGRITEHLVKRARSIKLEQTPTDRFDTCKMHHRANSCQIAWLKTPHPRKAYVLSPTCSPAEQACATWVSFEAGVLKLAMPPQGAAAMPLQTMRRDGSKGRHDSSKGGNSKQGKQQAAACRQAGWESWLVAGRGRSFRHGLVLHMVMRL